MDRTSLALVLVVLVGCGSSSSGGGGGGDGSGGGDAGGAPVGGTTTTVTATSTATGGEGGGGAGDGSGGAPACDAPLDCTAQPRCAEPSLDDEPRTSCPDGSRCTWFPGCLTPICIADEDACAAACGTGLCDILESDPSEVECRSPDDGGCGSDGEDELTCEDLQAELDVIQACTDDDECGRVLPGTSCGCTRNLVARTDVPVDLFEAMLAAAADLGCFGSTCDCPEADGFACVDGRCAWRYVD